jgi:hypothetical protein
MTRPKAEQADLDHEPTWRRAVAEGNVFAVWLAGKVKVRPAPHQYHPTLEQAERQRDEFASSERLPIATAWIEQYRDGQWTRLPQSERTGKLRLSEDE